MKNQFHFLQLHLGLEDFRYAILCFATAFAITLIVIPPLIALIRRYHLFDLPNKRKEHSLPIPTMGGIAIMAGLMTALFLWFPFSSSMPQIAFFFSLVVLFALGIMDDLKDLSARYKLFMQFALATLVAAAGIRITSLGGVMGVHELPLLSQYTLTILAITGITNAFNLIDGIDGLAGGLGFMSLLTLGLFLTLNGDAATALIAFALAGALMAFLYFNLNPARIFMGDTGSLLLGFTLAVLGIRLVQVNAIHASSALPHALVFVMAVVWIPVFDTARVFALRIWKGQSPFVADRSHIHHILTNAGYSHAFSAKLICFIHGFILLEVYWLRRLPQEWILGILFLIMCAAVFTLGMLARLRTSRYGKLWNASRQAA